MVSSPSSLPYGDSEFLAQLDKWVIAENHSALPLMVRAAYYYHTGLVLRGQTFVEETPLDRMASFGNYITKAWEDIIKAREYDAALPYRLGNREHISAYERPATYLRTASRATQYYEKSLKDMEVFRFPNAEVRDRFMAVVYNDPATVSEAIHDQAAAVAYGKAAVVHEDTEGTCRLSLPDVR